MPKILVISSVDPTRSAGIVAMNFYKALKEAGMEVDFLTKYAVQGHPEFLHVLPKERGSLMGFIMRKLSAKRSKFRHQKGNHAFDYVKEDQPPVPVKMVTRKIRKQYDAVFIVFWYQLLSYKTVEAIYDKLHCQIHLRCPDNQPIAGGCHFIGQCPRLGEGCGQCPGWEKQYDFTAANIIYRKRVIDKVKPYIYGNTHMQQIYRKSALLKDYDRLITAYPLVDNDFFHPVGKAPEFRDKFVLFFGCTILDEERKGMKYLIKALEIFRAGLSADESSRVLLLVAGNKTEQVLPLLPFQYKELGYVSLEDLASAYNNADVYLSPSIDDAGPSMVNQSISCGTPVVAFNIGTAIDMIKGHNTGYCAKVADAEDFAAGIRKIYDASAEEYAAMSKECRRLALERTTPEAFVKNLTDLLSGRTEMTR